MDVAGDLGGGQVEDDLAPAGPGGGAVGVVRAPEAGGDVGGDVAAGECARGEAGAGRGARGEAVDAEGAPVLAVEVPGDEVPAAAPGDQVVRFRPARWGRARAGSVVRGPVVEAEGFAGADGGAEGEEDLGVGLRGEVGPGAGDGGDLEGVDPVAQPGGMTWRTVARARTASSSMPAPVVAAVRRATARATTWSSSKSSGGSSVPAPSR